MNHNGSLNSIHSTGKLNIHKNQIRILISKDSNSFLTGVGNSNNQVSLVFQQVFQIFGNYPFVFNDQYLGTVQVQFSGMLHALQNFSLPRSLRTLTIDKESLWIMHSSSLTHVVPLT